MGQDNSMLCLKSSQRVIADLTRVLLWSWSTALDERMVLVRTRYDSNIGPKRSPDVRPDVQSADESVGAEQEMVSVPTKTKSLNYPYRGIIVFIPYTAPATDLASGYAINPGIAHRRIIYNDPISPLISPLCISMIDVFCFSQAFHLLDNAPPP